MHTIFSEKGSTAVNASSSNQHIAIEMALTASNKVGKLFACTLTYHMSGWLGHIQIPSALTRCLTWRDIVANA